MFVLICAWRMFHIVHLGHINDVQFSRCFIEGGEVLSEESWVFKSFLKVERDAPALVVLGSSFHQRGTTNENSLDCPAGTDGSAKRRSLDERSVLGVTFALTRAFR